MPHSARNLSARGLFFLEEHATTIGVEVEDMVAGWVDEGEIDLLGSSPSSPSTCRWRA